MVRGEGRGGESERGERETLEEGKAELERERTTEKRRERERKRER